MAISKDELQNWLDTLPEDADVAIDEGGLSLVEVDGDGLLEVGGEPLEDEP